MMIIPINSYVLNVVLLANIVNEHLDSKKAPYNQSIHPHYLLLNQIYGIKYHH